MSRRGWLEGRNSCGGWLKNPCRAQHIPYRRPSIDTQIPRIICTVSSHNAGEPEGGFVLGCPANNSGGGAGFQILEAQYTNTFYSIPLPDLVNSLASLIPGVVLASVHQCSPSVLSSSCVAITMLPPCWHRSGGRTEKKSFGNAFPSCRLTSSRMQLPFRELCVQTRIALLLLG